LLSSYYISDDCPKGNYSELKQHGAMAEVSAPKSFIQGSWNYNTWLLFIQYAACFGVELTMNNAAALYFREEFDLTTESAAAIGECFWSTLLLEMLYGNSHLSLQTLCS
jgi:MFS transporter, NNP family, nitrate/nitrite transporter